MPDDKLPARTLKTTSVLAALLALVFYISGYGPVGAGLAVGAAVALFSLWTLMIAVPRVFRPEIGGSALVVGFLFLLKLPLYAVVLYFAMTSRYISPVAVFCGVALVPVVLVLKVLGYMAVQKAAYPAGEETCRSKPAPSK